MHRSYNRPKRFQLHDDVKYFSAYYKYKFQSSEKIFNHYTNLSKADKYLRIRYSIYISMLQFQLYDGVKYFLGNYKYKFQLDDFNFVKT